MTEKKRYSTIANNYPSYQDEVRMGLNGYKWLKSRQKDDNAEGLWRIHDTLYDLTNFIDKHPGGPDWLRLTKGLDITEAFEAHHIDTEKVNKILVSYEVRPASQPRNYKFTFNENGFYRTLKRRMRDKLKTIDMSPKFWSNVIIDSLLLLTILASIYSVRFKSIILMIVASLCMTWTIISAHNYFHRRDNFRMFYFNIGLLSFKEWRISHGLSHHMYPNSLHDLEITLFEPFLCWIPKSKNFIQKYVSWIYQLAIYSFLFGDEFIKRILNSIFGTKNVFQKHDFIPFSIPLMMYLFNDTNISTVLQIWIVIILLSSFTFGVIGINSAHHSTETVHEGDPIRSDLDWGYYTLDTVVDNTDLRSNRFLTLTHFGHHAMHHLLPTIDHGLLPQLYPILCETMSEFETDLRDFKWFFHLHEQLKQLAREQPKIDDPLTRFKQRLRNNLVM